MRLPILFLATALLLASTFSTAAEPTTTPEQRQQQVQKFVDALHFQSGNVAVPKAGATLKLTPEFR